jgi:hypothetical protein
MNINLPDEERRAFSYLNEEQAVANPPAAGGQLQVLKEQTTESEEEAESTYSEVPKGPKIMEFTFTPEKIMSLMSKKLLKKMQLRWDKKLDEGSIGLDYKEFC